MSLEKYIEELLFDYECVTVPDFGAFLTRSFPFEIDKINGRFNPPKKKLTFNSLLTSNDGVLINYYAKKNNLNYKKAHNLIRNQIEVWRNQLKSGPLFLENIGKINYTLDKKIEFEPFENTNFDDSSFGLKIFNLPQLKSSVKTKVSSISKNKNRLIFKTKKNKKQFTPFLKYSAVFVFTLALSYASFYFGDQYIQDQRQINQQIAQNKIQENILSATFNLGSLKSISLITTDIETEKKIKINETHYSIIAGTFRNKSYAIRKIKNLKKEGYNSSFTNINPKGMFRVAYGRFKSKKEAMDLLYHIKYNLGGEAWFLKEN
tara:strand:- start:433 stop:1389 length:957 start_codon:yes stop_codon:yes gene_type:complete